MAAVRAWVLSIGRRSVVGWTWAVLVLGCGSGVGPPLSRVASPQTPGAVSFDFGSVGGSRLSSETTRGRATVVVIITTYDLGSQVVLRELAELVHDHEPRINALAVVLEPPRNAVLVDAFTKTLELPFPIVLADSATLEGRGPFGKTDVVPTLIVLDPAGVETWRKVGVVSSQVMFGAVDRASQRGR